MNSNFAGKGLNNIARALAYSSADLVKYTNPKAIERSDDDAKRTVFGIRMLIEAIDKLKGTPVSQKEN